MKRRHKHIIPIIFTTSGGCIPVLAAAVCSVLGGTSAGHVCSIVMLRQGVASRGGHCVQRFFTEFSGTLVHFFSIGHCLTKFGLAADGTRVDVRACCHFVVRRTLPFCSGLLCLSYSLIIGNSVARLFSARLKDGTVTTMPSVSFVKGLGVGGNRHTRCIRGRLRVHSTCNCFRTNMLMVGLSHVHGVRAIRR